MGETFVSVMPLSELVLDHLTVVAEGVITVAAIEQLLGKQRKWLLGCSLKSRLYAFLCLVLEVALFRHLDLLA